MTVSLVGINHLTAPVALRERLYIDASTSGTMLEHLCLRPGIEEAVILSTCNRTEIYAACVQPEVLMEGLAAHAHLPLTELRPALYVHEDADAARHLFRVAAGLDSLVIGETQILGQVRQALETAARYNTAGRRLNGLFQQAVAVGKRVRGETAISAGISSVGGAAVAFAQRLFPQLDPHPVLVLGAGKMAELTARHLAASGVQMILVANRTYAHACELAQRLGGRAIRYEELIDALCEVDVVISSTGAPHVVLEAEEVSKAMARRPDRPLCLIDIAVPRDIDAAAGELPNVHLYTIDDLEGVTNETSSQRLAEAPKADAIVAEELQRWQERQMGMAAGPVIAAICSALEEVRQQELQQADALLASLTPAQRQAVERLVYGMAQRMSHVSVQHLKEALLGDRADAPTDALLAEPRSLSLAGARRRTP